MTATPAPVVPRPALNPLHQAVMTECAGFPSSQAVHGHAEHPLKHALAHPTTQLPTTAHPRGVIQRWLLHSLPAAVLRAAVMVAGVGISLATLPRHAETWLVAVCGVVAWATSHIVAAVAWNGREYTLHGRHQHAPAAGALLALIPALIVAVAVAATLGSFAVLNWVVWATILAAGSVLWTKNGTWYRWSLWIIAVGIACWFCLSHTPTWVSNMASMLTISVVGVRMFWWLLMNAQGAWSEGAHLLWSRPTAASVLRVLSVVPAWLLVWQLGHEQAFITVSWVTMASAVASEILMPPAVAAVGALAARVHRLSQLRWVGALLALCLTGMVAAVSAGVWNLLQPTLNPAVMAVGAVAALLVLTHCVAMACGNAQLGTASTVVLGLAMAVVGVLVHHAVGLPLLVAAITATTLFSLVAQTLALSSVSVWVKPYSPPST